MGNFIFALERLNERGLLSGHLSLLTGQNPKIPARKKALTVAIGRCASKQGEVDFRIDECPPAAANIYQGVAPAIAKE